VMRALLINLLRGGVWQEAFCCRQEGAWVQDFIVLLQSDTTTGLGRGNSVGFRRQGGPRK
jgi:hypothetical protein